MVDWANSTNLLYKGTVLTVCIVALQGKRIVNEQGVAMMVYVVGVEGKA